MANLPYLHVLQRFSLVCGVVAMAACGGTTIDDDMDDGDGPPDPEPEFVGLDPTISSSAYGIAVNAYNDIAGADFRDTPNGQVLPSGTATYEGQLLAPMTVEGNDQINRILADIELEVELLFAGDDVSGTITNIHTISGTTPIERLGGRLDIEGELDDGTKDLQMTTFAGDLTGDFGTGAIVTVSVTGDLDGHLRDERIPAVLPFLPDTWEEAIAIRGRSTASATASNGAQISIGTGVWAAERTD